MNRLRLWILGAAFGSFAAGVNLGVLAPSLFAAEAEPTADDGYVRALADDYGLTARQQRLLRLALRSRRDEELALIGTVEADQLPASVQQRMRAVQRKLEQRIRAILDEEQRARYDLASRQDRRQAGPTPEGGSRQGK